MLAKTWTLAIVVVGLLGTTLARVEVAAQTPDNRAERLRRETDNAALQNLAPFKVFDNLYYVGVGYVGSWLVTTNQGLILIDTLEGAYKEHPLEGVRKLGFDPANIKYVILTHYHLDHTAGAARIQELPGVRLAMGAADWDSLAQVPNPNKERLPRRDIAVKDGDTITVGSTTVKLHVVGGHTPATLGVDFTVYDGGKPYRAFMFGGAAPGPSGCRTVSRQREPHRAAAGRHPGTRRHACVDGSAVLGTRRQVDEPQSGRPASVCGPR